MALALLVGAVEGMVELGIGEAIVTGATEYGGSVSVVSSSLEGGAEIIAQAAAPNVEAEIAAAGGRTAFRSMVGKGVVEGARGGFHATSNFFLPSATIPTGSGVADHDGGNGLRDRGHYFGHADTFWEPVGGGSAHAIDVSTANSYVGYNW